MNKVYIVDNNDDNSKHKPNFEPKNSLWLEIITQIHMQSWKQYSKLCTIKWN